MQKKTQTAIFAHAEKDYPREACGLICRNGRTEKYFPCRNQSTEPRDNFILHPEDYADSEDWGRVTHIVHSHPDATTQPSNVDHAQCDMSELPWVIVSWPEGDLRIVEPVIGPRPLEGRPFVHGVWDCFSIIRDWYKLERGIDLPNFERSPCWWESGTENLYMDNYSNAGFVETDGELQPGDVIIMQVSAPVPNHAAIYIGDGMMIHHMYGHMSKRVPFGGYYQDRTTVKLRHKALML
ncbi:TPA: C40 family peptidase [Yersinia enterocolitica]|uniref:C40 family peptidase n=2 Tax=Yersinia TaxID=629 RepID=A0AAD2ZAT8_YEREN|nr:MULTISPECIES: C40 family peptidase [Yersinia]EKN3982604.1 C40 family peptidase [Yersinia enterocolitica]EKN6067660.1 peptidase P60 [Yersinia enterocolitica]ELI8104379.1 C40 family peptidase [Yersinia enterocolitica]ELW7389814.1 C40 family peptidase [Yersinia enterocolitica]OVZ87025.1 peptidase P60 [Yersinia intermedia]